MERGRKQLGTLGSGNHFIEVDLVTEIYDEVAAEAMGLFAGELAVQVHTGSRGFGHQICTDYVRRLQGAVAKYGIKLPDKQLVCAPIASEEGQDYLAAMRCAANYAFLNRQILTNKVRQAFEIVLAGKVDQWHLKQVYDIAHNIGKFEHHLVDGVKKTVCVHRKGATRALDRGHRFTSRIPRNWSASPGSRFHGNQFVVLTVPTPAWNVHLAHAVMGQVV